MYGAGWGWNGDGGRPARWWLRGVGAIGDCARARAQARAGVGEERCGGGGDVGSAGAEAVVFGAGG